MKHWHTILAVFVLVITLSGTLAAAQSGGAHDATSEAIRASADPNVILEDPNRFIPPDDPYESAAGTALLPLIEPVEALPLSVTGTIVPEELGDRGLTTVTKLADEYFQKDPNWVPVSGTHHMKSPGGTGAGKIYYSFSLQTTCLTGTIQICVNYTSSSIYPWVGGPDLYVGNNETGYYERIAQSMPHQSSFAYRCYQLPGDPNKWVNLGGIVNMYVQACTDHTVELAEVKTDFYPLYPDLQVSNQWTVPGCEAFCPGASVDLYATVANSGSCGTMTDYYVKFYFDGTYIGGTYLPALPAGYGQNVYIDNYTWPNDTSSHTIRIDVDTYNQVKETSESNNSGSLQCRSIQDLPAPSWVDASDGTYCTKVAISWASVSGAGQYKVSRPGWEKTTNNTYYDDTDATPGTTYTYSVCAKNSCNRWGSTRSDTGWRKAVPSGVSSWVDATDGDYCDRVEITWASVSGADRYRLTRSGLDETVYGTSYPDYGATAGTQYTYKVFAGNECGFCTSYEDDTGYRDKAPTAPSGAQASDGTYTDKIRVTWIDNSNNEEKFKIYRDSSFRGEVTPNVTTWDDTGLQAGESHTYCVRAYNHCGESTETCDAGSTQGVGTIQGSITTQASGSPVPGVQVCATPGPYCATTNSAGAYTIANVPYGSGGTIYTVTPTLTGHTFTPPNRQITLTQQQPVGTADFTDTSVFDVRGLVTYAGTNCPAAGVRMLVDNVNTNPPTFTAADGTYLVQVNYGNHTIAPSPEAGHSFNPQYWYGLVTQNLAGIDFVDLLTRTLSGKVVGGCDMVLGIAEITITSTPSCFSTTLYTNPQDGTYLVTLPPLIYVVDVEMDPPNPLIQFESEIVDLELEDQVLDFIHHNPIEVSIAGFPELQTGCDVPIVQQLESYPLTIEIFERYGEETCPLDDVEVTIFDHISDRSDTTLVVQDGLLFWNVVPGEPNILAGGEHEYQKQLEIGVVGADTTFSQWVIVTGHKVREGSTFSTITPEIPFLILRDPPGDMSYSSITQATEVCLNTSLYFQTTGSVELNAKAKIGLNLGIFNIGGEIESSLEVGAEVNSIEEFGLCVRTEETFTTATSQDLVGPDADLFAGAAMNLEYQVTDVLTVGGGCEVTVEPSIAYNGDGYATTFIYTADHIRNTVIPNMAWHAAHTTHPDSMWIYLDSAQLWEDILALNDSLKAEAEFAINRAISGCTSYDYSQTTTLSASEMLEFYLYINAEVAASAGLEVLGSGGELGVKVKTGLRLGASLETSITTSNTLAHHLEDEECGDFLSVDVLADSTFGTPVFALRSGATSCPWEPPSQARDGLSLDVDPNAQYNVPPDECGVFTLYLGNESATNEARQYCLTVVPESNPDGAEIYIAGQPLTTPICYTIPPGEVIEQTMTVCRGPLAYEYFGLEVRLYSPCDAGQFADTVSVDVTFASPCSPIEIYSPPEPWVVNVESNNELEVVLTGYDSGMPQLIEVQLQYRELPSGDWITPIVVPVSSLPPNSVVLTWDVSPLDDGDYAIRGRCVCTTGASSSPERVGVIDRQAPRLFGLPQPSDHRLDPGENIAFTFDETLDCGTASALCCSLRDAASGDPITVAVACNTNQVILDPLCSDYSLENRTLVSQVTCLTDLYGNMVSPQPIEWQFLVDLGPVHWNPDHLEASLGSGQGGNVASALTNRGTASIDFTITDCDICTPSLVGGTIPGNGGSVPVTFAISDQLSQGVHADTVYVNIAQWPPEPLYLTVTVGCSPPDWFVNPSGYSYNGSITAAVYDGATNLGAAGDLVGAFVGTECRGVAAATPIPGDQYVFPLMVYSNQSSGEMLTFRFYDASSCTVLDIEETVEFDPDMILGNVMAPYPLHAQMGIQVSIPFSTVGYHWFSLRVTAPDMSLDAVLASIEDHADYIKDQFRYAQYVPSWGCWWGTLDSLTCTTMYVIHVTQADTLVVEGTPCPGDMPLPLVTNWNWIPYLCSDLLPLDDALASIGSCGEFIKNQTQYAQYVPSWARWWGTLTHMRPNDGYKLKMTCPGVLIYPCEGDGSTPEGASTPIATVPIDVARWGLDPHRYLHQGSLTAQIDRAGSGLVTDGDVLLAYVGEACRGVAAPMSTPDGRRLFCLMAYTDGATTETMTLRFYDHETDASWEVLESFVLEPDGIWGSPAEPVRLTLSDHAAVGMLQVDRVEFGIQSLRQETAGGGVGIAFGLPTPARVDLDIFDVQGRQVRTLVSGYLPAGLHSVSWNGRGEGGQGVASGVYFCRLSTDNKTSIRRLTVVR